MPMLLEHALFPLVAECLRFPWWLNAYASISGWTPTTIFSWQPGPRGSMPRVANVEGTDMQGFHTSILAEVLVKFQRVVRESELDTSTMSKYLSKQVSKQASK